jgi:hypothetical protein
LWQVWFGVFVDGRSLDGLVERPIDVMRFNWLLAQSMTNGTMTNLAATNGNVTAGWAAVMVPANGTVSVSDCLKVYVTGIVSQLDWDNITQVLKSAVKSVEPSGDVQF